MTIFKLRIRLKSAASFGSGDGVAGLVDREIEQDSDGFPYLRGRTLKGLLVESAENIVFALTQQGKNEWGKVKQNLFGKPGKGMKEQGILFVSDAQLPETLRQQLLMARNAEPVVFSRERVLNSLTGIRQQTAVNPNGAPDHATLRAVRVLLPGTFLEADIITDRDLQEKEAMLLATAVLDMRRAGISRNRGRGWLQAELNNATTTEQLFQQFVKAVS